MVSSITLVLLSFDVSPHRKMRTHRVSEKLDTHYFLLSTLLFFSLLGDQGELEGIVACECVMF